MGGCSPLAGPFGYPIRDGEEAPISAKSIFRSAARVAVWLTGTGTGTVTGTVRVTVTVAITVTGTATGTVTVTFTVR